MGKKVMKGAALAAVLGTVFGWGGCLGGMNWQRAFWNAVEYGTLEYLLDNNTVFNLWNATDVA